MTTDTQSLPNEKKPIGMGQMKAVIFALLLDTFLWAYTALVLYKIVYEKLIMGVRFPVFSWNQPTTALVFGGIISLALFFTKFSIGRATQGSTILMKTNPF